MISHEQAATKLEAVVNQFLLTPPGAGQNWMGIQHGELVRTLRAEFVRAGGVPCSYRFDLSRDGADMTAGFLVPSYPGWVRGFPAGLALVTSNARRSALRFYAGLVEECSGTPLVTAQIAGWRFVKCTDVELEIKRVVREWTGAVSVASVTLETAKERVVTKKEAAVLLVTACRKKIMPWSYIGPVDGHWQRAGVGTAWGLIRAFWQSTKNCAARDQMGRCLMFTRLVTGEKSAVLKPQEN